ncbi:MAG: preprotein translocase subunit SecY [Deltaproteobacteria bacterium]|nr:preprotein translocase subunit SecY [Deltaproteobacteria bacterium]
MSGFANIGKIPELRKRLLFTLMILAVYRIGIFVTVPGCDRAVMREIVASQAGTFLSLFNMFSGGALEQLSIFALGIMPYVSASIILQLLTVVFKPLEELRKEGEAGQRKINQYTRYGTIVLSFVQSLGIAMYVESLNGSGQYGEVVAHPGWPFRLMVMVSLTTGTAFIMWLGEQITERGIGNGTSLIIFAGIVADLPDALFKTFSQAKIGQIQPLSIMLITAIVIGVVATIVFFERGQRRIQIQYAKRMVGRKMYGGQSSHLPLRVNTSGVIPPIFASSILMFPGTLAQLRIPGMEEVQNYMDPGGFGYNVVYILFIIFFCYFYTAVTFQPVDVADNLKKQGAFIPGIRPGKKTADYIDRVLTRITFGGACYVATVCVIPSLLVTYFNVPFYFGGTSMMIVVGVALDTVNQIESHLITRHYEGFTGPKGPRIRGRRMR